MPLTVDVDVSLHFELLLSDQVIARFVECSGIGGIHEVVERTVLNVAGEVVAMKLPGRRIYEDIVLKQGITSTLDLWAWRKLIESDDADAHRDGSILVCYSNTGDVAARWDLQ